MSQSAKPSQRAAEVQSADSSTVVPLGTRGVYLNDGTYTVSLPEPETCEGLGIDEETELELGYDPVDEEILYRRAEDFDGWD